MIGVRLLDPPETTTASVAHPAPLERPRALVPRDRRSGGFAELERIIRGDVIPCLMLTRRQPSVAMISAAVPGATAQREQIEELAKVVLTRGEDFALAYVESIRSQGTSIERLYLDLITPVARHLGDLWSADICSFIDVTVGLWRLQHVVQSLSPVFQQDAAGRLQQHQALLVPMPGEKHTFGLYLVSEFFRRAGWGVWSMPLQTPDDLVAVARSEWFTLVGLSLNCESRLEELATNIRNIRRASCNRSVAVMVGGAIFIDHPELVVQVGADLMAVDGGQAPAKAQEFVTSTAAHQ
jgi:MerR family transcriptional regulator, light-induced transcriptional regulator